MRLDLARRAVRSTFPIDFPIVVKSTEIDEGRFIPTIYLIEKYRNEHPDCDFAIVIGSDLMPDLMSWDKADELVASTELIVVARSADVDVSILTRKAVSPTLLKLSKDGFVVASSNISSTEVRKRIRAHGAAGAAGLVPLSVLVAIEAENLFQAKPV